MPLPTSRELVTFQEDEFTLTCCHGHAHLHVAVWLPSRTLVVRCCVCEGTHVVGTLATVPLGLTTQGQVSH